MLKEAASNFYIVLDSNIKASTMENFSRVFVSLLQKAESNVVHSYALVGKE